MPGTFPQHIAAAVLADTEKNNGYIAGQAEVNVPSCPLTEIVNPIV